MATQMPKPGKIGGLGEKVENTFVRFLTRVFDNIQGGLANVIRWGLDLILEAVEGSIADKAGPMLAMLQSTGELPGWLSGYVGELQNPTDQGTAVGLSGMAMGAASQMSSALLAPILRKINYAIDRTSLSARLSPAENFAARWRYPEYIGQLEDGLRDLGYTTDLEPVLEALLRPRLSGAEGIRAAWLDNEDPQAVLAELKARGYLSKDIEQLVTLLELRPGPADLVRMGVREAWRDDVAAKWGYDSDFPGEFGAEMERAGDTEGWAKRYWRAHWELPGLGTVLEMLHRDVITSEEFNEYLRIADYPSGWRDRIAKVAYTPYTRVDTRRMYRFGVLDETGVYDTYRDIGYDHEHAVAMTQFTVLDALTDERELTKADVLKSYRLARFSRAEAQKNLEDLGYNATVAAMLLGNEDQAQESAKISGVVSNTHSQYIRGGLSKNDAMARMAVFNLASTEIARYFELWDLEKASRIALPTRSALDGFLGDDIITVAQYQTGLTALSYQAETIAWYTQGVLLDKAAKAEKEKDRAISEADKVAKREVTTAYQRGKALLTVALREVEARIGELQTAIQARGLQRDADIAFARQRATVEQLSSLYNLEQAQLRETRDTLSIENREYREDIEELQTQIAGLRLELETTTDEALKETARLQVATLQAHKEDIQTIQAEGRAEIAMLEAEISGLVDPTLTEQLRSQIAELQSDIEWIQDTISVCRETQAQIKRALLDAGPDEIQGLKAQYLDLAVEVSGELVELDELQTKIAGLRELNIDPELAGDLHSRQELMAEVRANNAQAAVFLQEIDQSIVEIRLTQIDPERAGALQALRVGIAGLQIKIEQAQDQIAAGAVSVAELQAALKRLAERYRADLSDLARVTSAEAVEAAYRADLGTLQDELARARANKNSLRVQLAEVQYEYAT